MSQNFVNKYLKSTKSKVAFVLSDDKIPQPKEFISTGSYAVNTIIAADPYKGLPAGKILQFAGPGGCGKTYLAVQTCINAQQMGYTVVYFDTEFALVKENLVKRGLDPEKTIVINENDVEKIETEIINICELAETEKNTKLILVIDSIGFVTSSDEIQKAKDGKQTAVMSRNKLIKKMFRTVMTPLGLNQIPMIVINHVYDNIGGYGPATKRASGGGVEYGSSIIIEMRKSKQYESSTDKTVTGALVTLSSDKNRFAKEHSKIQTIIDYNSGIIPFAGLLQPAVDANILGLDGTRKYKYRNESYAKSNKMFRSEEFWKKVLDEDGLRDYLISKYSYHSSAPDPSDILIQSMDSDDEETDELIEEHSDESVDE